MLRETLERLLEVATARPRGMTTEDQLNKLKALAEEAVALCPADAQGTQTQQYNPWQGTTVMPFRVGDEACYDVFQTPDDQFVLEPWTKADQRASSLVARDGWFAKAGREDWWLVDTVKTWRRS